MSIIALVGIFGVTCCLAQQEQSADWQFSLIGGGFSKHLSDSFEPAGGYKEFHEAIGIHVEEAGDGWVYGALAMRFTDSYDEDGFLAGATLKYNKTFDNDVFIFGGVGAGYVDASHYRGAVGIPLIGLGYKRISLNLSYLPALDNSDELLMGLISVKLFEW